MPLIRFTIEHHIKALTFWCNPTGLFTHRHSPLTFVILNTPWTGCGLSIDYILSLRCSGIEPSSVHRGLNGRLHIEGIIYGIHFITWGLWSVVVSDVWFETCLFLTLHSVSLSAQGEAEFLFLYKKTNTKFLFVFIRLLVCQCVRLTFSSFCREALSNEVVRVCVCTRTLRLAGRDGKGQCDEFRNDRKQWTFLGPVN